MGAYGDDSALAPGEACGDLNWPCCAEDGPEGGKCLKMPGLTCSADNVCVEEGQL